MEVIVKVIIVIWRRTSWLGSAGSRTREDLVQTLDDLHSWKAQIPGEPRLEFASLWCTLD
jgi:hypothetical protein